MKLQGIIADGHDRWHDACEIVIRGDVAEDFEERIYNAGFLKRIWLRWQIRREIYGRLKNMNSPYNLHSRCGNSTGAVAPLKRKSEQDEVGNGEHHGAEERLR